MKTKTRILQFFLVMLLGGVLSANAQEVGEEEIEFNIQGGDDTPIGPGHSKTPILVPTAWLNGHVVDFHGAHADYVLRIVDSTNAVVYSTPVPSSQTQVWLPTYLVGIYRIELLWNGYIFYGYITL